MKRSYTYLKGLLTLALAAFTGWMWATTYSSLPSYTITSANYATLTSPVLMPETAVDSFTVTIMWTGGNQRSDISQVKLIDPETDTQVAVDTHDGFSGENKQNHVYTLANIPATYAGKVLLVKSTVKCNEAGGSSTCDIQLSNGVTHTDYTDITEVIAINFASDKQAIDTAAEGDLGFVTADGVQGAQVPLAKWNNAIGGANPFEYTITVAGAKTESTYSLTYSAPNSWNSKGENTFNTPIGNLTKGYLDVSNHGSGIPNISLAGMPATGYDVAVILSGDGESFGAVTVNGKNYIGSNGTTIAGEASWGSRQSYDTLAEGQNVVFVTEQSAETLTVVGQATASNARASIAGLMVFFRKIPPTLACTYTVTDEGGSWDVTPSTAKPCVATIAFAETTGKSVDLATILGDVKSLKSLIITGTKGGTIANTDGVTAASVNINTNAKIPSSFATPAVTTIGEGALAYFTGETTVATQQLPYSGNRHFENIKFTATQVGSGIANYIVAENETMLFTTNDINYIPTLIVDGGSIKTTGSGHAWFGGAADTGLTIKSGVADFSSVTSDSGSAAVLIGYSGNGHTFDIQGGLLDASNTSIVGWELNSKYHQSGGLVKTKGFRQNGDRITEMTLTGGTVELGAGGIPNLGMASATLSAATIRATADATIAEALNVTGAATLQAVEGKTLTVSGAISGEGTIAIGGTATTKVRADDGTYSDAPVNATGTVDLGTNRPKIASIAEGATLKITLTDAELENGISWTVGENLTTEEANRLEVVGAELDNITVTNGTLTATLASSLAASWENGTWSKTPVTGSPVTITFSEGNTTCTFTNTEAIELATLTIKGEVAGEIVLGDYAVAVSAMTVEPAEVTIPVALFNTFSATAYEVASGKTLKLKGDADVSKKVDVRGTLVLAGSMNFTAGNYVYNGGKLEVLSGESTFNTGDDRGFQDGSIVKIAKGATLKNGKADAPGYNNVTLDIAGTLEVTDGVRWSLGASSSTTLHEGAVLKGTGENDGDHRYAFDYFSGATITVDGDAKIEGNIGAHNGGTITFNVTSDKTLTIEGAVKAGSLATSGAGTVKLAGANAHANTSIANGSKLVVASASALGSGNITLDGALTFKDVEATFGNTITQTDPSNTTNPTGQIVIDNSTVTLNGPNGNYKGSITINEGATLKSVTDNYAPFGNGASIVNNGAIVVENSADCAIAASMSGNGTLTVTSGNLYLFGANTYKGTTTIATGAKVIAQTESGATWNFNNVSSEPDITVNGELELVSSTEIYRGIAGAGTVRVSGDILLGNTGNGGELSGLSRFTGTLIVAAEKTLTLRTWGNQYDVVLTALEVNGTVKGETKGGNGKPVVIKTSTLSGSGTIDSTLTLAAGATLAGAVTVTGDVTVAGALTITHATKADDVVITCNNAADILASLPTLPTNLKYDVAGNTIKIKLAVAKVNVTIPAAPANTKWYDADGNEVEAGTIEVDPNQEIILTLKADDGYVFADGSTSTPVTIKVGENGATVETPDVTAATPVAQVGETKYQTLDAAIAATTDEAKEVKLLADVDITKFVTINKSITLNLNGYSITRTDATENSTALYVNAADKTVTITGDGTVTADHAVYVNAGTVIIENGTFEAGSHAVYVQGSGNAEILGGTFSSEDGQYHYVLNEYDATRDATSIVVKGGKFLDFNPANNEAEGANTNFCAEGHIAVVGEGEEAGYYVVVEIPETAVAMIGKVDYDTLAGALAAAQAGQTITLVKDINASEIFTIETAITLDGNGKILTSTAGRAINVDCDGAVTIKNLTIDAGERAINIINQAATVTINGVTATADNNAAYIAPSAGAVKLAIDGCNFTGMAVVYVCGENAQVTIANTTITNKDDDTVYGYGAITVWSTATNATVAVTNTTITVEDDSVAALNYADGATITGVGDVTAVVAKIGDAGYTTIEEAAKDVKAGQTIVLVTDVTATKALAIAGTLDLNGYTSKGTILGKIAVNGGTYITAENVPVIGTNARAFETTNAVFTMDAVAGNITLNAGTVTAKGWDNGNNWTVPGQALVVKSGVTLTVPAEVTMQVNGTSITIENGATLNIAGKINLYSADATIEAAEVLTVTTTVAGCEVKYADGKYIVVKSIVVPPAIAEDEDIPAETKEAIKEAMEDAGVAAIKSYTITTKNTPNAAAEVADVADVLAVFEVTPTVEANGVLTVAYEFGISAMTNVGDTVTITAGVTGAEYRAGVEVVFYADGAEIGKATTTADSTTVSITEIDAEEINGKKITVKAATK